MHTIKKQALPLLLSCAFSYSAFADNPIVSHVFTADPAARVFNERMYVITSHDVDGATGYSSMKDYYLFSSEDMINWRDHGVVFDVRTDSSWANNAFAPDFIEKGGKYYLYYPNGGNSIGVAVADHPEGPYVDPLGKPLVSRSTPGAQNVEWVFDPGVFIDDDGSAYLYFGGAGPGNLRVIRLNDDMISINGSALNIDAPHFFEAPYVVKRNGIYYLTYSTNGDNGSITIDYLTSDNPITGFEHQGTVLNNPWDNRGNNNHQSMIEWKGEWYMFYHNRRISEERGGGVYERSINVDLLSFDGDKLALVADTTEGVPSIKTMNPYKKIEAETIDNESKIETNKSSTGEMYVAFKKDGWIQISNVDFGSGATEFELSTSASGTAQLDLFIDSMETTPVATISIPITGSWRQITKQIPLITGTHDVYLRANEAIDVDWYQFTEGTNNPPSNSSSNSSSSSASSNSSSSGAETPSGGALGGLSLLGLAALSLYLRKRFTKKI